MAEEDKIDIAALDKDGGIPELCRRTSQPYDYSEKQLEEKTHVSAVEAVRNEGKGNHGGDHAAKGKGCGKAGCTCDPCTCGASCKCGDSGEGAKKKGCGKAGCNCDDCKCGSNCQC